jgi:hypothetical protein
MECFVDPTIADLQAEYAAAVRDGQVWQRRWALLHGYIAFAKVFLICGLFAARQAWRDWNPEDQRGLVRVLWLKVGAIVSVTLPLWLLELPRTREMVEAFATRTDPSVTRLMAYLLPAILPLSMPVGLAIGATLGVHSRAISRRLIGAIIFVAVAMSAASFVALAWVTPATNQSYREELMGRVIPKGDRELTLAELRRSYPDRDDAEFEFHSRLGVAGTPMTFATFALVITIRRRARLTIALAAVGLVSVGYLIAFWVGRGAIPSPVGAWMPQILLVATTILMSISATSNRASVTRTRA